MKKTYIFTVLFFDEIERFIQYIINLEIKNIVFFYKGENNKIINLQIKEWQKNSIKMQQAKQLYQSITTFLDNLNKKLLTLFA